MIFEEMNWCCSHHQASNNTQKVVLKAQLIQSGVEHWSFQLWSLAQTKNLLGGAGKGREEDETF